MHIKFHKSTAIKKGKSITSNIADEQKFSCTSNSNSNYPIYTWYARYQEIFIHVKNRLKPERASLEEMQTIVETIDKKVANNLDME